MALSLDERRQSTRFIISDLQIKIGDRSLYYTPRTDNISMSGLKLSYIPIRFDERIETCACILYAPNKVFLNVDLHPKWVKEMKDGRHKIAGFQIISPPHLWREFIAKFS